MSPSLPRCHVQFKSIGLLILSLAVSNSLGHLASAQNKAGDTESVQKCVLVELYISENEASNQAKQAAIKVAKSRKGVRLIFRSVTKSKTSKERLRKIARHFRFDEKTTPVIYCCNQAIWVGNSVQDYQLQLEAALRMEIFIRHGCVKCAKAKKYLPQLSKKYPAIEVVYREITTDVIARGDLSDLVRKHRKAAASTPVFHFCNQLLVGFDRDSTTGPRIEKALGRWFGKCKSKKKSAATKKSPKQSVSKSSAEKHQASTAEIFENARSENSRKPQSLLRLTPLRLAPEVAIAFPF